MLKFDTKGFGFAVFLRLPGAKASTSDENWIFWWGHKHVVIRKLVLGATWSSFLGILKLVPRRLEARSKTSWSSIGASFTKHLRQSSGKRHCLSSFFPFTCSWSFLRDGKSPENKLIPRKSYVSVESPCCRRRRNIFLVKLRFATQIAIPIIKEKYMSCLSHPLV